MADPPSATSARAQPPYPAVCPKCHERTGQPYDVWMPGPNIAVSVYLECETCKHQWSIEGPVPLPAQRAWRR